MIRKSVAPLLLLAATLTACAGSGDTGEVISRERFVDVYVALRTEARLEEASDTTHAGDVDPEARDRVLAAHGVEMEDLLGFVDAYGTDVQFMSEVWSEIEARLAEQSEREGGGSDPAAPPSDRPARSGSSTD